MEERYVKKIKEVMDLLQDIDLTNTAQRTRSQKNLNEAYIILETMYATNITASILQDIFREEDLKNGRYRKN